MRHRIPREVAHTLAVHVIAPLAEICCGLRPATQARTFTAPALLLRLAGQAATGQVRGAPIVQAVYGQRAGPHGHALEVWGRLRVGGSQLAYAGRVELHRRDWRVLEFRVVL